MTANWSRPSKGVFRYIHTFNKARGRQSQCRWRALRSQESSSWCLAKRLARILLEIHHRGTCTTALEALQKLKKAIERAEKCSGSTVVLCSFTLVEFECVSRTSNQQPSLALPYNTSFCVSARVHRMSTPEEYEPALAGNR